MGQKSGLTEELMVVIGRIGAPFGVKGWAHVQSFTQPETNILSYKTWYLKRKGHWQAMSVLEAKAQGKGFVAVLKDLDTRELIATLTNVEIAIPRSLLPVLAENEYYWADLIGLTVLNETGETLGEITGLLETGSNDVLVVKGKGSELLIPYIPDEVVIAVDLASHTMQVVWDPEF